MTSEEKKQFINKLSVIMEQITTTFYESSSTLDDPLDFEPYKEPQFDALNGMLDNSCQEKKLNEDFAVFGERGCSSKVAVWLLKNRTFKNAPVVLIGSEGELEVIASDYLSFMVLSASGYDMYQFLRIKDLATPWHSENPYLLNWLKINFDIQPPNNLIEWFEEVKRINPEVKQTIELTE